MIYENSIDTCCSKPIGFSCSIDTSDWPKGERSPGFARPAYSAATHSAPIINQPCCYKSCDEEAFPTFSNTPVCCVDDTCIDALDNDSFLEEFLIALAALIAIGIIPNLFDRGPDCPDICTNKQPTWPGEDPIPDSVECTK